MKNIFEITDQGIIFNYENLPTRPGYLLGPGWSKAEQEAVYNDLFKVIRESTTHKWFFKVPEEQKGNNLGGFIYLPEYRFGLALLMLRIAYAEVFPDEDESGIVQGKGEYFNPQEPRRWSRIDDNWVAIDMSYSDDHIDSLPDVSINDAYKTLNYTEAVPSDCLLAQCFRAFLKRHISLVVEYYYSETTNNYADWPEEILWVDNDQWVADHPEIQEFEQEYCA